MSVMLTILRDVSEVELPRVVWMRTRSWTRSISLGFVTAEECNETGPRQRYGLTWQIMQTKGLVLL